MKILFVSNIFPPHVRGGYELGCLELAEKYQELGHSVIVATSENTAKLRKYSEPIHIDTRRIFMPVNYYDDLHDYHFQSNSLYYYEKILAFAGYIEPNCIAFKRLIELEKPDLIWIFNPLGIGPIGIFDTAISCGVKTVIHLMEHLDGVIQDYSNILDLTAKWKYLKTKITAISCSQKIYYSNNILGEYHTNKIIYNWVNTNKHISYQKEELTDKLDFSASVDVKNGKFKLVYFGQIAEKKGIEYLYQLARYIKRSPFRNQIIIELYGKGEVNFVHSLEKRVLEDELSEIFVLKGFLEKQALLEKIAGYNLAIFLLSNDEPFAYAPIEAMLKEVPVIVTGVAGVAEILKDKYDALLIEDRKNIDELYQKVVWSLQNPMLLKEIRKNALVTIGQKCDLDTVTIPALNNLIEEVPVDNGYSFEYVLSTCENLKYSYVELNTSINLKGARYKFIDTLVSRLYNLPVIGKILQKKVKDFVQNFRSGR
jgi:glycogen synthase